MNTWEPSNDALLLIRQINRMAVLNMIDSKERQLKLIKESFNKLDDSNKGYVTLLVAGAKRFSQFRKLMEL